MISWYDWPGGREAMLRFGPAEGPVVVVALPLFEEANRTRAFVVTILRELAARGIASALPDLPGTGESLVPLEQVTLTRWFEGYVRSLRTFELEDRTAYAVSFRGGAIIEVMGVFPARWHFAPMDGADVVRDLLRAGHAAALEAGRPFDASALLACNEPVELAGNLIRPELLRSLEQAAPFAPGEAVGLRVVRLESDPRPADRKVTGLPLWRRAEPDNDPALAALLADDIATWIRASEDRLASSCEG